MNKHKKQVHITCYLDIGFPYQAGPSFGETLIFKLLCPLMFHLFFPLGEGVIGPETVAAAYHYIC